MLYIPNYKSSTYPCVVVQNATTLRAYKQKPYNPGYGNSVQIEYRDFYYTANYNFQDNRQNFSNSTNLPICMAQNELTDVVFYRNDFDSILIIFLILSLFSFYIPIRIFMRLFRRFL